MKQRYNIDKLKICYRQPTDLFTQLSDIKLDSLLYRDGYELYIIPNNEEDNPSTITVNLLINSNLIGHFVFNNSKKYEGFCFFSFENKALYDCLTTLKGEKYNSIELLEYVSDDLGLTFNNITEIEIACDTVTNIMAKVRKSIRNHTKYDMIYNGKRVKDPNRLIENYKEIFQANRKRLLNPPTLYFSQVKENRPQMKIYCKTEEIKHSQKDYITHWNDFQTNRKTYRAEITVKNESLKEYFKTHLPPSNVPLLLYIQSQTFMDSVYRYFTDRLIYFRSMEDNSVITLSDMI